MTISSVSDAGSSSLRGGNVTYYWQHVQIEQTNETVYIVVLRVNEDSARTTRSLQGSLHCYVYFRATELVF